MESFSTIQDVENLAELHIDENSDLCVKVDNPQKVLDTLETYITFRITTKVARIEFPENEYIVRRRYNDFLWLRQKLVESHPFCIIPVMIMYLSFICINRIVIVRLARYLFTSPDNSVVIIFRAYSFDCSRQKHKFCFIITMNLFIK